MIGRPSRRWALLGLVPLALVATACPPQPPSGGGTVPSCPARVETVVSRGVGPGPLVLRGMSDGGDWVVTSTTAGGDTVLTLRSVDGSTPPTTVTTLTGFDDSNWPRSQQLVVGVSDDGNSVIVDGQRWERSSGDLVPLAPPEVGALRLATSDDRSHTLWDVSGQVEHVVTESFTDEVLDWTGMSTFAGSGRFGYSGGDFIDHAEGTSESLGDALDQIDATGTWTSIDPLDISDNGRFVLFLSLRDDGGATVATHLWSWDRSASVLLDVTAAGVEGTVSDGGVVVWPNGGGLVDSIRARYPDGGARILHDGFGYMQAPRTLMSSTDADVVAYSAWASFVDQTLQLFASRCQ